MIQKNIVYCTYFDKDFLQKGLSLHSSLLKFRPDAILWILAFDKYTEKILKKMKLKGVKIISLSEFEDSKLLAIKNSRNRVEYIWTCTPSWALFVLKKSKANYVVYLDADFYFYSDVLPGVKEIGNKSILAVEHRFPPGREHIAKDSGRFNVGFNIFTNNKIGINCLNRWRKQCLDWCYWRNEDGKLGDQMYLDEWPKLYSSELVISQNIGVDTAPWNVSQYKVSKRKDGVYINNEILICYHFHQFQVLGPDNFSRVLGYTLSKEVVKYIYEPYEKEIAIQYKNIRKFDPKFIIKPPSNGENKTYLLRQKLAKYIGPAYWRMKGFFVKQN